MADGHLQGYYPDVGYRGEGPTPTPSPTPGQTSSFNLEGEARAAFILKMMSDPRSAFEILRSNPQLFDEFPELQTFYPSLYQTYQAGLEQPVSDLPEEEGGQEPVPQDNLLGDFGFGEEAGGVDPSLQAQIDWWRQQFAGEQQMSQAELDWSKEMFARQQAFEREKLGQQQVQWSEEFGWDKMIEQARQQEAAQAMAFQQQQAQMAQQMARQQLMASLAGPQDWLKAGIIGQGQMAQPGSWLQNFGISPDAAMQTWKQGGDWASQAQVRPIGGQAWSNATPEQIAMMQGLSQWQSNPAQMGPRAFRFPIIPESRALRQ